MQIQLCETTTITQNETLIQALKGTVLKKIPGKKRRNFWKCKNGEKLDTKILNSNVLYLQETIKIVVGTFDS